MMAMFCLIIVSNALGQERDVAAEFKAARAGLTLQLNDKKKETRLAAIRKLETFPTTEAAKLLLFQGLSSTDEDVRRGSFDVLAKFTAKKRSAPF